MTLDEVAEAEEALPAKSAVTLMRDEISRLDELLQLSDEIVVETKIERLLVMIAQEFAVNEPILLFTEYKATQALVLNALHRRFGFGSASFINGDDRLDGLEQPSGKRRASVSLGKSPQTHSTPARFGSSSPRKPVARASICKSVVRHWFTWTCLGIPCVFTSESVVCRGTVNSVRCLSIFCEIPTPSRHGFGAS